MSHESVTITLAGGEPRGVDLYGVIALGAGGGLTTSYNSFEGGVGSNLPGTGHCLCIATTRQYPRPQNDAMSERVTAGDAMGKVRGSGRIQSEAP